MVDAALSLKRREETAICKAVVIGILILITLTGLPANIQAQSDDGLVAEWHFDEGSGSVVKDSSGYGNAGTIHGARWVDGKRGKALSFDGVDDYVNCGNDASLNLRNKITIEAWIYPQGWGEYEDYGFGRVVDKEYFLICLHDTAYSAYNDHSLAVSLIVSDSAKYTNTPANSISLDTWQHIAATYDGVTVNIYINGKRQSLTQPEGAPSGSIDSTITDDLLMGEASTHDRAFNGIIDEVRIYNRVLTLDEVKAHYSPTPPPTTPPPTTPPPTTPPPTTPPPTTPPPTEAQQICEIKVYSDQKGSTIYVDGKYAGTTLDSSSEYPGLFYSEVRGLSPGRHTVRVSKTGFQEEKQTVEAVVAVGK